MIEKNPRPIDWTTKLSTLLTARLVVMRVNPLKKGKITEKFAGIGTVDREMVIQRAAEIAVLNEQIRGRHPAVGLGSGQAGVDWRRRVGSGENRAGIPPGI